MEVTSTVVETENDQVTDAWQVTISQEEVVAKLHAMMIEGKVPESYAIYVHSAIALLEKMSQCVARDSVANFISGMRETTPEENKAMQAYLDKVSIPTGLNIYDLMGWKHPEGWISVRDKLPEPDEIVIVSIHDDSGDTVFDYTLTGWVCPDGTWIVDNERNFHVKFWKSLPEPCKE